VEGWNIFLGGEEEKSFRLMSEKVSSSSIMDVDDFGVISN
jgi:hypothetical protein